MFAKWTKQNTKSFLPDNLDRKTCISVIFRVIEWREFGVVPHALRPTFSLPGRLLGAMSVRWQSCRATAWAKFSVRNEVEGAKILNISANYRGLLDRPFGGNRMHEETI